MANNVKFNITAVDKTKQAFNSVTSGLKKVTGALFNFKTAIAGAVGVAGLGLLIKKSLEATDRIGKLSYVLGFSAKELQAFKLASEIGGMDLETFSKGVRRLVDNFGDFIQGTGEAKATFEALGITVKEASKLSGDQFAILGLVADRLNKVTNSTDRLKFAMELFGGRGAELINVLKGGSEQIAEFSKQSERFGALNDRQVKQVEDLNDSIVRLKTSFSNITNQIVANLAPALTSMIDDFNDSLTTTETGGSRISEVAKTISLSILSAVQSALISLNELSKGVENTFLKIKIFERDPIFFFKKDIQSFQDLEEEFNKQFDNVMKLEASYGHLEDELFIFNKRQSDGVTELIKSRQALKHLAEFLTELRENGYGQLNEKTEQSISFLDKFIETVKNTSFAIEDTGEKSNTTTENVDKLTTAFYDTNEVCTELSDNLKLVFNTDLATEFQRKISDIKVNGMDLLISTTEQLSGMFAKTFTDALYGVKSLKEGLRELSQQLLRQLLEGLIKIGLQVFIFDAFEAKLRKIRDRQKDVNKELKQEISLRAILALFTGFGGGRANGGQVEGSKAFGGYVQGSRPMGGATGYGKAYMVGERGAELFVPNEDGTIIPNDKLGGTTNISLNIYANDTKGFDDLLIKRRSTIINVINDALNSQGKEAII